MKIQLSFLRSKVARRILVLFITCALVPIAVLAVLSFTHVRKQIDQQVQMRLHQSSKIMGMIILERLLSLEADLKMVIAALNSKDESITDEGDKTFTQGIRQRFHALALVREAGVPATVWGRIENPPTFSGEQREHINSGRSILYSQYHPDRPPTVFMCRALAPQLPRRGILLGEINADYVWGTDQGNPLPSMAEFCVVDQRGEMLFSSLETPVTFPQQAALEMTREKTGRFQWQHEATPYLARYRSIYLKFNFFVPKWTVVLSEPESLVFAPMARFKRVFPLVFLLSLWVVLLLSLIQIRRSLRPIEILRRGTLKVADGDYESKVEIKSGDEFEMLADSFNDMTEKIKVGQALLVQTAKMGAIGQMAAGIVHEINQPMTSIYGLIQLSLLEAQPGEKKERLETIKKAVERLTEIVSRFRSFSRRSDERKDAVSVNVVVDDVHRLLEHQMQMKKVKCILEKEENLPSILGDTNSLQQVFTNLIINGIDALEEQQNDHALIKLRTYSQDAKVCVDVEDNGPGIPKDKQSRIFDPFFTTKSAEKGTGLGLAIIHSILHNHGAGIQVESDEEAGTRFIVSFPVAARGALNQGPGQGRR